jgi:hypothetical protein
MRRRVIPAVLLLAALAACTASRPAAHRPAAPPAPTTPAAPVSLPPASGGPGSQVALPAGRRVLVPVVARSGAAALPVFTTDDGRYTLYIRCAGGGTAHVDEPDGTEDVAVPCDESLTRYAVADDPKSRPRLFVRADQRARWSAGVIAGAV